MGNLPLDKDEFRRWRDEADVALRSAHLQTDAGINNWACFSSERAAQRAVKALLHGLGRGPWGHDLVRLGESAIEAGVGMPGELADALKRLGRHYIAGRYPDAHASGSPGGHYGEADARQAIQDSEAILRSSTRSGRASVAEALDQRRRERERLLGLARRYVERLSRRLPLVGAAVVGSVARGDFNVWSDVDVLVVAEGLPERTPDRGLLLVADAPAGVQAVGFTPEEFERAWTKQNALAREVEHGVVLEGEAFFQRFGH